MAQIDHDALVYLRQILISRVRFFFFVISLEVAMSIAMKILDFKEINRYKH